MPLVKDRQNFLLPLASGRNALLIKMSHCQLTCLAQRCGSAELFQISPLYARGDAGTASALPRLGDDTQNLCGPFGSV